MVRRRRMFYRVPQLIERDGTKCHYCGCELNFTNPSHSNYRTVDHRNPRSAGEKANHNLNNLVLCCQSCNIKKGNLSYKEFKRF